MISKEIILVSAEADIDLLWTMIDREHLDREATEKIKRILHRFIGEKLSLVIEYPYYDCDYLSTYYIYYAKKRKKHAKECYRIHLVKGDDTYFGYFVLRPSSINKVARAYLRPDVCFDEAYLILTYYTVNYMGQETEVAAFPWISQETDVNVCAHVALLTVSRFFGNRFKNYADRRMGDIVCDAPRMTNRSLPTESLCGFQISEILRKCGFTPLVLKRAGDVKFNQAVLSYVESRMIIAFLTKA